MPAVPLKALFPIFTISIIGALITGSIFYLITKDRNYATFVSMLQIFSQLISSSYDLCCKGLRYTRTPQNLLPITNDTKSIDEKMNKAKPNVSSLQTKSHGLWFKLLIVSALTVFFRIITTKWFFSFAFFATYLLHESYQYVNRIYNRIFPSNHIFLDLLLKTSLKSTKNWSNRKIIVVALCINIIQFLLLWCMFMLVIGLIVPITFETIYQYCKYILDLENNSLSLRYKILNFIIESFEKHGRYIFTTIFYTALLVLPPYQ
ncbi:hypothetical protein, no similarity [Maudiozyma saulgeensis]|uniref:Uncharacterized protein n=1 Tax=Maudiozyma saulgeensis TaxID=1789683 RepID=A0A1X7RAT4_9SACH|nr:hypothetical protein, no similarity [Kazachstania saulgeensis]